MSNIEGIDMVELEEKLMRSGAYSTLVPVVRSKVIIACYIIYIYYSLPNFTYVLNVCLAPWCGYVYMENLQFFVDAISRRLKEDWSSDAGRSFQGQGTWHPAEPR